MHAPIISTYIWWYVTTRWPGQTKNKYKTTNMQVYPRFLNLVIYEYDIRKNFHSILLNVGKYKKGHKNPLFVFAIEIRTYSVPVASDWGGMDKHNVKCFWTAWQFEHASLLSRVYFYFKLLFSRSIFSVSLLSVSASVSGTFDISPLLYKIIFYI